MRFSIHPISTLLGVVFCVSGAAGQAIHKRSSDLPPRKVIVGTVMKGFWGEYPGLQKRLEDLTGLIDRLTDESRKKYGRGLDLAVLPESAVTGEITSDVVAQSAEFDGPVKDAFVRKARECHCYIVVPMFLLENREKRLVSNVAILIGRKGEIVGMYRKLHLAVPVGSDSMEGGVTPGKDVPVFQCDFGKLGIQICFDIQFDYGWKELARKGADLVAWPTQSPGTARPAFRAMQGHYYVVSSTWRHNASIAEPTGKIVAQVRPPGETLVQELDLSYAIVPWSTKLQNGAALQEKYGDKVGFRYYEDEDQGIFWSNDPQLPIRKMLQAMGLDEFDEELVRIEKLYDRAGVPGGSAAHR
jgi:predicted amidohydrolase